MQCFVWGQKTLFDNLHVWRPSCFLRVSKQSHMLSDVFSATVLVDLSICCSLTCPFELHYFVALWRICFVQVAMVWLEICSFKTIDCLLANKTLSSSHHAVQEYLSVHFSWNFLCSSWIDRIPVLATGATLASCIFLLPFADTFLFSPGSLMGVRSQLPRCSPALPPHFPCQ